MWENRALEQLLLLSRSVDDDALLAVMASRFGHTAVPLVSLTTIIQQKAHASIVGNYAAGLTTVNRMHTMVSQNNTQTWAWYIAQVFIQGMQ